MASDFAQNITCNEGQANKALVRMNNTLKIRFLFYTFAQEMCSCARVCVCVFVFAHACVNMHHKNCVNGSVRVYTCKAKVCARLRERESVDIMYKCVFV